MSKKKNSKHTKPRAAPPELVAQIEYLEEHAPDESTPIHFAPAHVDLPSDPERFWHVGRPWETILPPESMEGHPALKRLGPLPFPRTGFPLMGFLATLYDHVATHAREAQRIAGQPDGWPATQHDQPIEGESTATEQPD